MACLNVFSKKLLTTSFSAISLLHLITKFSLIIFLTFYGLTSIFYKMEIGFNLNLDGFYLMAIPLILLLDGFMSFSQNILAFSLLSMCSPLTYSIANCSKRVAIISLSFIFFSIQNITFTSLVGIFISLIGILCYNFAKHNEKKAPTEDTVVHNNGYLPMSPDTNSSYSMNGYEGKNMSRDYSSYSLGSFYNV